MPDPAVPNPVMEPSSRPTRGARVLRAVLGLAIAGGVGVLAAELDEPGGPRWTSILPPLTAVLLAMLTERVLLSLGAAVVLGGLLEPRAGPTWTAWAARLLQGPRYVLNSLWQAPGGVGDVGAAGAVGNQAAGWTAGIDWTNVQILAFVFIVMALVAVVLRSGGLQAIVAVIARRARTPRSTQLATCLVGWAVFIDDYTSAMVVGPAMRPLCDRQRVSREKLAFLVDSTAAPVTGMALVSTWIGNQVGQFASLSDQLGVPFSGYDLFVEALPYRFYGLMLVAFLAVNTLSGREFGPMRRAEERARRTGAVTPPGEAAASSAGLTAIEVERGARLSAWNGIIPLGAFLLGLLALLWFDGRSAAGLAVGDLGALVSPSAWRFAMGTANTTPLLCWASGLGLVLAGVLAVVRAGVRMQRVLAACWAGLRSSLVPCAILLFAWGLKNACEALGTDQFLVSALRGRLAPQWFPALTFALACLVSFAIGTSWGTMAILIPIAGPLAVHLEGGFGPLSVVTMAAVLDGAIFGDHASPISDTTVLSSIGSSCNLMAHVRTQLPYALVTALAALFVGYVPAGLGWWPSPWLAIPAAAALFAALFLLQRPLDRAAEDAKRG